ncbi:MAG: hypothetical protein OHK0039_16610 [Bacteroidia bacterium]
MHPQQHPDEAAVAEGVLGIERHEGEGHQHIEHELKRRERVPLPLEAIDLYVGFADGCSRARGEVWQKPRKG